MPRKGKSNRLIPTHSRRQLPPRVPNQTTIQEISRLISDVMENAPDTEARIAAFTMYMDELIARRGASALRAQRDAMTRIAIEQQEMIQSMASVLPHIPVFSDQDRDAGRVTAIECMTVFSDSAGNVECFRELTSYPALFEQALTEVLPQITAAINGMPGTSDIKTRRIDGMTDAQTRDLITRLWQARRLHPDEYGDRLLVAFNHYWPSIQADMKQKGLAYADTPEGRKAAYNHFTSVVKDAVDHIESRLTKRPDWYDLPVFHDGNQQI